MEPRIVEELGGPLTDEARAVVDPLGEIEPPMTPAQRRADAIGLLADRALARGFPPECGTRARRYEVVLHVDRATLAGVGAEGAVPTAGISELEDGIRISAETSRRLTCDATVRTMTHQGCDPRLGATVTGLGHVLDVGRRRRTVPPAMRRALEVRDGGCRFPGCGSRFTDAHHIIHWADGGSTSLDNLVLLCLPHHRLVHGEGYQIRMDERGQPVFATPSGRPLPAVPAYDVRGRVEALLAANRERGVTPDFRTGRTRWGTLDDVPLDVRERVG